MCAVRTLLPLADVVALIAVSEGDEEPTTVEELQSRMSLVGQVTWANFAAAMPEVPCAGEGEGGGSRQVRGRRDSGLTTVRLYVLLLASDRAQ